MKVYELMTELAKMPAGKDVSIICGEAYFIPTELDVADEKGITMPIIIFAKKDK